MDDNIGEGVNKDRRTLVGAVDQGTSSSRFLIFDSSTSELITYHQTEIKQSFPHAGWVEEDPREILDSVLECVEKAVENLQALGFDPADIKAIGITNQRETTVVWDRISGEPLYHAIVWLDARTTETVERLIDKLPGRDKDALRPRCGLPMSTYFSALKLRWILDNCPEVQKAAREKRCLFGTVDSWLLWNLTGPATATGGVTGDRDTTSKRVHVTDVTNASRTMLMNIHTCQWDPELLTFFEIDIGMLPEIRSSSEIYGLLGQTSLAGIPISGILGDQQAALVGQQCLKQGRAKNTYGTGCFMLYNTGTEAIASKHGLLTTVAFQLGHRKPIYYALEGSVAIAGAAVKWLRDNTGMIRDSREIESLASSVTDTGGCYFVPAFSGLFCPYWQPGARGIICGLSQFTNKAHIARACLEAVCFQTCELLEAMERDSGLLLSRLQVDGGMANNSLLMQLQADLAGIDIARPSLLETTALGAAMAAGAAKGVEVWDLKAGEEKEKSFSKSSPGDIFTPALDSVSRNKRYAKWKNAVQRSMGWEESHSTRVPQVSSEKEKLYAAFPFGMFLVTSVIVCLVAAELYAA